MRAEKLVVILATSAAYCATHAFHSHVHHRAISLSPTSSSSIFTKTKEKGVSGGGSGKSFGASSDRSSSNDGSEPLSPLEENHSNAGAIEGGKRKGDALRDATGIRSSLHPTTVNCVAEALRLRSQGTLGGHCKV